MKPPVDNVGLPMLSSGVVATHKLCVKVIYKIDTRDQTKRNVRN